MEEKDENDEKDDKIRLQIIYQNINKYAPYFPKKFSELESIFKELFDIKKGESYFHFTYPSKIENSFDKQDDKNFKTQMNFIRLQENPSIYVWDSNKVYKDFMDNNALLRSKYYLALSQNTIESNSENDDKSKENIKKVENELRTTEEKINNEKDSINILKEEMEFLNDITGEKIPKNYFELKKEIKILQDENEKLKETNIINTDNLNEAKNKLKNANEKNEILNNKIVELENQLAKINKENGELKNQIEINKSSEEEMNKIKEQNKIIEEERDYYKNAFVNKENEIKNINAILSEFQDNLKIKEEELNKKIKKENELVKKIENYKQKINELKENLNKQIKEFEENIDTNI